MKILIVNGPNLNLLGQREPEIYGNMSDEGIVEAMRQRYENVEFDYFQSNVEGVIIDCLQNADGRFDGIVLNAGGYSHTSVAIRDCIAAIKTPVVEVHISNIYSREEFRRNSIISSVCKGVISGFGVDSYRLAIESFLK